jgi:hypothetical protein
LIGSGGILAFTNWLLNCWVLGLVSNVHVIDCVRLTAFSQSDNCHLSLSTVQSTTILFLIGSGGILAFTNWLLNDWVLGLVSNVHVIDRVRLTAFSQSDNCHLSNSTVQSTTILFLIGSGGILAFTNCNDWVLGLVSNVYVIDCVVLLHFHCKTIVIYPSLQYIQPFSACNFNPHKAAE